MALQDLHQDPERLRTPIRRTDKGWQPMTWDDAFDLAAQRLDAIRRRHGRNSLGVYLGNPNVLKQGVIRDHFYYDVDDLDLSWTILD